MMKHPIWFGSLPVFSPADPPQDPPPSDPPPQDPPPSDPPAGGKTPSKTGLDAAAEGTGDDKKIVAPADWPEDWRDKLAGDGKDKDATELLKRAKSPTDIWKSYRELQKRVSAGKVNEDEPMPDADKDADKAKAWREQRGIPDDPTGYKVPETLEKTLTPEDKPIVASFMDKAHAKNWNQKQVAEGLELYFDFQQQAFETLDAADAEAAEATEKALIAEYGTEYRTTAKLGKQVLEAIAPGLYEARLPDGRKVGNIPEVIINAVERGREFYGDVAFAGGENTKTTLNRKAELQKIMADEPERWHAANAEGQKLRTEYDKILEAEERRGGSKQAGSAAMA
jgi:hypothetical protein